MDAYAAQSAFYIVMGFIPFMMLLLTLLQYTPLTEKDLLDYFQEVAPSVLWEFFEGILEGVSVGSTALLSGTVIAGLWACGRSVMSIINGLNSIWGYTDTRNYFVKRVRGAAYVAVLLVMLILALGLLVYGNIIQRLMMEVWPVFRKFSVLIVWGRTAGALFLILLLLAALYAYLPAVRQTFYSQLPGAAVAALGWLIGSYIISLYVGWQSRVFSIYGSLTTMVMIMLWLYFIMWMLFAGAQFNKQYEEHAMGDDTDYPDV